MKYRAKSKVVDAIYVNDNEDEVREFCEEAGIVFSQDLLWKDEMWLVVWDDRNTFYYGDDEFKQHFEPIKTIDRRAGMKGKTPFYLHRDRTILRLAKKYKKEGFTLKEAIPHIIEDMKGMVFYGTSTTGQKVVKKFWITEDTIKNVIRREGGGWKGLSE